jgi:hypothetical protein
MPNVAEVIRDHVTLGVECVDRLYLNAYVPGLQRGDGVVAFLRQRGQGASRQPSRVVQSRHDPTSRCADPGPRG